MKLLRHGPIGRERPGLVDAQGSIRDLTGLLADLTPDQLSPAGLRALAAVDASRLPAVTPGTRIGVPIAGIRQFIGIGLNYRQHAMEAGMPIPAEPIVFSKSITALAGPDDDLPLPAGSVALDYEVELGIVIGSTARRVTPTAALSHVAGYVLANDVSERDWQLQRGGQWMKGKCHDGFGPIGPWLVTTDEIPDPQAVALALRVNGEVRQDSSSADMIFGVAEIVSYLSDFMTLLPGDVIVTGTPQGVGMGFKPPKYLKAGDVVELRSPQLGRQRQRVVPLG
ncbi:MAG: fumarylacetoacetate hydrolase family protein [Burkholderiaceae bacterium]|jgi:2-keto-4-pentenoate hydratase/2-oxohepta-3-ene-1,7-dioic acid hydratase in catechol pathway